MLVRRDGLRHVHTRVEIDRLDALLRRLCDQDERDLAVEALIEAGALEAAVADALSPDQDGFTTRDGAWRTVTLETAKLFRASRRGDPEKARASAKKARKALADATRLRLPERLSIETADGYAWRGLYPETFLEAAERFLASSAALPTVVVGLRGVGASLSAVVAATLEASGRETESLTVRAHQAGERRIVRLDERLTGRLARRAQAGVWFLLVDDGPGSTGASFAAAAAALNGVGARDEQIVLFPGLAAEGVKLRSAEARSRWGRHRKLQISFEAMRDSLAPGLERSRDLSRGLWREVLNANLGRPVTAPQHERRKYLSPDGASLFRYAGLGRSGRERLERAGRLAEAGFTPEPKSFADGFLAEEFVSGRSLHGRRRDPSDIAHAARYLGWLGRHARTGAALTGEELTPMILKNVEQSLGDAGLSRLTALDAWPSRLAGTPAVAIDGRLAPHEWIRSERGLLKTDALDHHDDRFMPGPTDLAWDVAGFSVEWGLDANAARDFAAAVAIEAADATLARRLPFYETAYLAFRTGFTQEAAEALPEGSDRRGLRLQAARYRARLGQALDRMQAFG